MQITFVVVGLVSLTALAAPTLRRRQNDVLLCEDGIYGAANESFDDGKN